MTETMRALVITKHGGPEVLEVRTVPRPEPGAGEVRIRVTTSGMNRADLLQRRGRYPPPEGYPEDIPGLEFAGTVSSVGAEVEAWSVGDRVMGIVAAAAHAEEVLSPAGTLVPVPEGMDLRHAGAVPEAYMTAYDAIRLQEGLETGETLLIHAVGSGVGTAALQIARSLGARVIGTSRTPEKLERASHLGLEHPVHADDGWPERVLELTGGAGVDVILDLVGAAYLEGNQRVLARRGRHVVVGIPSGRRAEVDLRRLMDRRASIRGTVLRARSVEEKAELARAFREEVIPMLESGEARPVVDRIFPAEDAAEAHRLLEENRSFGKLLLEW
jgi:putative PIG3 family NAD(P)H quinone oxidoreductase